MLTLRIRRFGVRPIHFNSGTLASSNLGVFTRLNLIQLRPVTEHAAVIWKLRLFGRLIR